MTQRILRTFVEAEALSQAAAAEFVRCAVDAVAARPVPGRPFRRVHAATAVPVAERAALSRPD